MVDQQAFEVRTYQSKSIQKVIGIFIMIGTLFFLYVTVHIYKVKAGIEWNNCIFVLVGCIIAYIFWNIPSVKIVADGSGIKILRQGNSGSTWIKKVVLPDTGCEWRMINAVSTTRNGNGNYRTYISIMNDFCTKSSYPMIIDAFLLKDDDYASILKMLKVMAPQAQFDEMSEQIISGQRCTSGMIRPFFKWLLLIVLIVFLLAVMADKLGLKAQNNIINHDNLPTVQQNKIP